MDNRLALNVATVPSMSIELKTILYNQFRKSFKIKPHVAYFQSKTTDVYQDIDLSASEINFYNLCACAFLIVSGKAPMNYSIWYDTL